MFFLKQNSEVYEIFKAFKASIENFSGKKIKVLRNDNGKEYSNNNIQDICEDNFILLQHSVPYTPKQNGVAEHKNRALKEIATSMLAAKYLYPNIWNGAINCAAYFHNIFPQKYLEYKTPFEAYRGHKPNVSHFKVFRSKAWVRIPLEKRKALKHKKNDSIMVVYYEY